jgi:DNA polymerase III alpha subunit (gram-positive type)
MLIFYDLESTGLNPYHDKITEICLIKQIPMEFNDEKFSTLINPEKTIPAIVTKITGIDEDLVKDKLTFNQISNQLLHFINYNLEPGKTAYFIAHNNEGYDKIMFNCHLTSAGIDVSNYNWIHLDTLLLAKKLYPHFKRYNLKSLCEQLGVEVLDAHRAEADTIMLKNIFYKMILDMEEKTVNKFDQLVNDPKMIYDYYH